jgi:hypothetical protein
LYAELLNFLESADPALVVRFTNNVVVILDFW